MADNTSIPIIVQGNSFSLAIPLQIYVIDDNEMVLEDYTPDPTDEVSVQLKGSRRNYTYTPTIDGNVANIDLSGNELADNYSVVVSIVKANGQRLRSFRTDQFFIVESSDDLTQEDIIAGLEENVIYLNAQAFIAGADGRGIEGIQKTGTSGLVDTYTISYTDNTTSTFQVTNGANGQAGAQGVGITSIEKTGTSGLVDTYTITLSNGQTSTFEVTNGKDGVDLGLATIVDNLVDGGSTNVLSAEMGKDIKNEFDGATQITGVASTTGYHVFSLNGTLRAESSASYTAPINVTKGQIIKVVVSTLNTNYSVIAKVLTADTSYQNKVEYVNNQSTYIWTADEDCQIAISFKTADGYRAYIMNDTSGLWDNVMELKALEPKVDNLTDAIDVDNYTLLSRKVATDGAAAYGNRNTIVGCDKAFSQRSLLDKVKMCIYSPKVGSVVKFYLGKIDQRNWLLPRLTFTAYVTSLEQVGSSSGNKTSVVDLSPYHIIAEEGEVLFFSPQPTTSNNSTFGWSIQATIPNVTFYKTSDINTALETDSRGIRWFEITAKSVETYLALETDVEKINTAIEQQAESIAKSKIYYDRTTGEAYKIIVNNGVIQLKSASVSSLLVLGHSFAAYNEVGFWQCDDNRGMAATIAANDYPTQMKTILGSSTLVKKNVADWERNLVNYDFATNWAVTDVYDAIVLFVGANIVDTANVYDGYVEALTYLKQAAPTADIYVVSMSVGAIYNGAKNAASAMKVDFIDITYLSKYPLRHLMGDYYIGKNSTYYEITADGVANHPADYGHWLIAQAITLGMGNETNADPTHNITLMQAVGGTISACALLGVEGGVITIHCSADEGYAISSIAVVDGSGTAVTATARSGVYTFIMPSSDVTVTPTWAAE